MKGLTPRQLQIGEALGRGESLREIADHLGISLKTAEMHVRYACDKLGLKGINAFRIYMVEKRVKG